MFSKFMLSGADKILNHSCEEVHTISHHPWKGIIIARNKKGTTSAYDRLGAVYGTWIVLGLPNPKQNDFEKYLKLNILCTIKWVCKYRYDVHIGLQMCCLAHQLGLNRGTATRSTTLRTDFLFLFKKQGVLCHITSLEFHVFCSYHFQFGLIAFVLFSFVIALQVPCIVQVARYPLCLGVLCHHKHS